MSRIASVFASSIFLSTSADAGYLSAFVTSTLIEVEERAKRVLSPKERQAKEREDLLAAIHEAIHYKKVMPTVSGIASKFSLTRPVAHELLAALVERGQLRQEDFGVPSAGRMKRYISRAMP